MVLFFIIIRGAAHLPVSFGPRDDYTREIDKCPPGSPHVLIVTLGQGVYRFGSQIGVLFRQFLRSLNPSALPEVLQGLQLLHTENTRKK